MCAILKCPLADVGRDILSFWKANQFNCPILSAMAKTYLAVKASSVLDQRAFSAGTELVTSEGCSLGGETIEMTQFLRMQL